MQKELTSRIYSSKIESKAKINQEDQDWMVEGLCSNVAMMRLEDEPQDKEDMVPEYNTPVKSPKKDDSTPKNSLLSVGRSKNRSYVVRGSQVQVYSPAKTNGLKHETTLLSEDPNRKTPFSPHKVMLHKSDDNLLLLNPLQRKKIFCMDLERGKVVEEWDTQGLDTKAILPETKDGQSQVTNTFLGVNNAGFFVVDPRSPRKVVRSHQMTNASNSQFDCGATTQSGDLAVGTRKGEIRLFNQSSLAKGGTQDGIGTAPRAKTRLVGYGDPITAVDVSRNGHYILATCDRYLILCHNEENGYTGFQKSVRMPPILLTLKSEDIILIGGPSELKFTAAKFNVKDEETFIVCSTGNWLVTWDFSDLLNFQETENKEGLIVPYQLKWYKDEVVADDFTKNEKGEIILAMPDEVKVHHWQGKSKKF